jgi:hypothetical protein
MYPWQTGAEPVPQRGGRHAGSSARVCLIRSVQEGLTQAQCLGRAVICKGQTVAWDATLSLAASLARELRGLDASGWAKSQTAAQQTGLGTASVPSRGPLCPLLAAFGRVLRPFWRSGLFSCRLTQITDWSSWNTTTLTDELCESIFQRAETK